MFNPRVRNGAPAFVPQLGIAGEQVAVLREQAARVSEVVERGEPRRKVAQIPVVHTHQLMEPLHDGRTSRLFDVVEEEKERRVHLEARVARRACRQVDLRSAGRNVAWRRHPSLPGRRLTRRDSDKSYPKLATDPEW